MAEKAGGLRLPRNNPSYDVDAPVRSVLHGMMDRLGETSPLPELAVLNAGSVPGGFLTSFAVKTQERNLKVAERAIRERQLVWLERLGGCTRENGMVFAAADTIHVPRVNSEQILDETVAYTAGQGRRQLAAHAHEIELFDAWNEVLFRGAVRRKVDEVNWTRARIIEAIDTARGELDDQAVMLIASSMAKIGYDPAYPMLVWVSPTGERYIVDGRHRDAAADERGLEPAIVERTYDDIESVLAAIVRADETRRGFTIEDATSRWAEIGIDMRTLRSRAGSDVGSAELVRKQRSDERAGRRARKKEGASRSHGRPKSSDAVAIARDIIARRDRGEHVNSAEEARLAGISDNSVRAAIRRERSKTDTSVSDRIDPDPPAPPLPPSTSVAMHTCGVCNIAGPAQVAGWCRLFQYGAEEMRKPGDTSGRRHPFRTSPFLDGVFHKTCVARLSWSDYASLFRGF